VLWFEVAPIGTAAHLEFEIATRRRRLWAGVEMQLADTNSDQSDAVAADHMVVAGRTSGSSANDPGLFDAQEVRRRA
jgi:hypothetical protein